MCLYNIAIVFRWVILDNGKYFITYSIIIVHEMPVKYTYNSYTRYKLYAPKLIQYYIDDNDSTE